MCIDSPRLTAALAAGARNTRAAEGQRSYSVIHHLGIGLRDPKSAELFFDGLFVEFPASMKKCRLKPSLDERGERCASTSLHDRTW